MSRTLKTIIQVRRDTTANWLLHKDCIPADGEPCLDTDTGLVKYGDGVTTYEHLRVSGPKISGDAVSIEIVDGVAKLIGIDGATEGQQLAYKDGKLSWVTPDTSGIDGLAATVAAHSADIASLKQRLDTAEAGVATIATKLEVEIPAALAAKVDKVEGKDLSTNDFTNELKDKLVALESGAQCNIIERIIMAGIDLSVSADKSVEIPAATNETYGVVIGSKAENKVFIAEDGTMEVYEVSMSRLVQEEGETIILGGGNAAD